VSFTELSLVLPVYNEGEERHGRLIGPSEKATGSACESDKGSSQKMSGKIRAKRIASTGKRVTKRERTMTVKESSDLLESASQALAMVQGSKLIGGRISVRQAPAQPRARDKKDIVELRERLTSSQGMRRER
jgi:hypothetical protein